MIVQGVENLGSCEMGLVNRVGGRATLFSLMRVSWLLSNKELPVSGFIGWICGGSSELLVVAIRSLDA